MKAISISLVLMLVLLACSSSNNTQPHPTMQVIVSPTPTPAPSITPTPIPTLFTTAEALCQAATADSLSTTSAPAAPILVVFEGHVQYGDAYHFRWENGVFSSTPNRNYDPALLPAEAVQSLACVRESTVQMATYSDGSLGFRRVWDIVFLAFPDGTPLMSVQLEGDDPSGLVIMMEGSTPSPQNVTGAAPVLQLRDWLFDSVVTSSTTAPTATHSLTATLVDSTDNAGCSVQVAFTGDGLQARLHSSGGFTATLGSGAAVVVQEAGLADTDRYAVYLVDASGAVVSRTLFFRFDDLCANQQMRVTAD